MKNDTDYIDFVISKLSSFNHVKKRTVFGGVGLFIGSILFCIIKEKTVYMIVSEKTKNKYLKLNSKAFKAGITKDKNYESLLSLPMSIFYDDNLFCEWAKESYNIAKNKTLFGENHIG